MRCCFDCKYFRPESTEDVDELERDEALAGECRRCHPVVGEVIHQDSEEERRWFGEFPKVKACDWCGEFIARTSITNRPNTEDFVIEPPNEDYEVMQEVGPLQAELTGEAS